MNRTLLVLMAVVGAACAGPRPSGPEPQSPTAALEQFLAAVKDNNLGRMSTLWGTARGPAVGWMPTEELRQRLSVIQRYLAHAGSRVVEGPLPLPGRSNQLAFRVELQRTGCNHVQPIDVVRTRRGGWLVADVHLESATNPARPCPPEGAGNPR